ncbi:unnamed protein product [Rotaria socialis]|uniref:R3H domain-containing protein n=1 Tax=Rotaria socialis TaxID=392032 RepID=A0A821D6Z9_9BILA|nr:unnamed protein product [Rotaria socialis]
MKYDSIEKSFRCKQLCKKEKSCRIHRCNRTCCNLDIHQCELICGKILNCGVHTCKELCHFNFCRNCSLVDQEIKSHECGHSANHWCHNDGECPPCTHAVPKMCVGEHMSFDVQCHVETVCYRQPCGKFLLCTVHTCQRSCQSFDQKCTQQCNLKRRECGHKCNLVCHGDEPCPETICNAIVKVICPCAQVEHYEKNHILNIKPNEFNEKDSDFNLTSYIESLKVYIENSILARKQQQQLECDDECHVILQNKNLTQAVSVKLDELRQLPTVYTDFLLGYAPKNLEFVETIQRQLTQLVEETQAVRRLIQFYSFTPMQFHERYLIHQSAPFYGLQTQATNPEPNRKTAACASCGICKIPSISLSETVVPEKL